MISVIAISGETYDLSTGRETPKGIILSNGIRNITIEVSDEVIKEVILLDTEARNVSVPKSAAPLEPKRNGKTRKVKVALAVAQEAAEQLELGVAVLEDNPLGEAVDPPPEDDPGFDYADSETGVASV